MTPRNAMQRHIDAELEEITGLLWLEEERMVWCPTTGWSLVPMTHRINCRLEAELVRRGKIHNE